MNELVVGNKAEKDELQSSATYDTLDHFIIFAF